MIHRLPPRTPAPVLFGERYKSKPLDGSDHTLGAAFSASAAGGGSGMMGSMGPFGVTLFGTGAAGASLYTAVVLEEKTRMAAEKKAQEPVIIPDTPQVTLQKALDTLNLERQKQQATKDSILNTYRAEQQKLETLQAKLREQNPQDVLERSKIEIEISLQEKSIAQMKITADSAVAVDQQLENQTQTMRKKYLTLIEQLQQIEQNQKVLEMQKSLEALKAAAQGENKTPNVSVLSPDLETLQDKIQEALHLSNASVEAFLQESAVLIALQKKQDEEQIDQLKKKP